MGLTQKLGTIPLAIQTDTSNNVGIGAAANASFKLQVTGATNLTGALSGTSATFSGAVTLSSVAPTLNLTSTSASGINEIYFNRNTSTLIGYMAVGVNSTITGSGDEFIIDNRASGGGLIFRTNNGGTSAARLTIASTGAATFAAASGGAITLTTNGSANNWTSAITGNSTTSQSYGLLIQAGTNSTDAALRVRNQANSLDWLFVRGDGNVGIGTSSPANLLHLVGASATPSLRLGSTSLAFYWDIGRENLTTGDFVFNNANGGAATERMRITSGGNVLMGSTNDSTNSRLYINTSSSSYGIVYQTGSTNNFLLEQNGNGYLRASAWSYGSDRRLKENIINLEGCGLDKILKLNPVRFDYINGVKNNIGWIAQDVQEVIPEAVGTISKDNDQLTLKSDFIVPYLVKAIQELEARIKQLENK
jgi:hypothetical protein